VNEIQQAHLLLAPLLGTAAASALFAIALLCAGQSSTITGTMAGQIVMEGFLNFRMRPWLRRFITRLVAIIPAVFVILTAGEEGTYKLLILSQVILSMQLPFAVIPLIHFTSDRARMGTFANKTWVKVIAWTTAAIIVSLNIKLVISTITGWIEAAGPNSGLVTIIVVPLALGLLLLLVWVSAAPLLPAILRRGVPATRFPADVAADLGTPAYSKILVPLDHTDRDRTAIAHAAAMARTHGAKLYLLHVEEGVTSQVYGSLSSTAEVEAGREYLAGILQSLRAQGIEVEVVVRHSNTPRAEIIRAAKEIGPDLLIMAAHGHKGLKDLIFGATINAVRHALEIPLLVVRDSGGKR
jgi:manganese transport protein